MSGPLDGLVVADFSRVLAGPYATMLLADMGARVIKIERPGVGDDTRHWGPPYAPDGTATYFAGVNRNKWSIALDLAQHDDSEVARAIVGRADILVENFKPGTLDRYGLGVEACHRMNPRLISCSITGFGTDAALPGYDLLAQAMGGLMSITGTDAPTKVGVALVDVLTGLHAVTGILAALHERDRTGEGQHLDVNLLSSVLSAMVNQSAAFVLAGQVPKRMGNAHPSIAPYEVLQTADQAVVIAVGNDTQFRELCQILGRSDLADDPRFRTNADRVLHRDELVRIVEERLSAATAREWQDRLTRSGIPCGPINSIDQAFELANQLGLAPIAGTADNPEVAHPVRFADGRIAYASPAPTLNQHRALVVEFLADRADRLES
jgi:crotonobetainyl-CoA:carnitine CoA-transferase CaiB-like acyl-CoA transferase